jgi:hypothetical protein
MGYRLTPLSSRRGLAGLGPEAWQVDLPQAECFLYFVAHLHQLFGRGHTLYVEGRELAPDVLALYQAHPAEAVAVLPIFRNPATARLHVALGSGLGRAMNRLAACRTYAEMGEAMLVYGAGKVWMDGRHLGERRVLLDAGLSEAQVRRFAGGLLRGQVSRPDAPC